MNHIEKFLQTHAADIPPSIQNAIREHLIKGHTRTATELIPDFLQPDFLAAIESEYRERNTGKKFNIKDEVMPRQGFCSSSKLLPCRI